MGATRFKSEYFNEYKTYMLQLGADNSKTRNRLLRNLRTAVQEELTPRQREFMEQYYFCEKKMTDIAQEAGVNVSTVSRTINRGKARIRRCLRYGARELLREVEQEADWEKRFIQ